MFYSTDLITDVGIENEYAPYGTIAINSIQVLMTFVSMVVIEIAGRRLLLLGGLIGMSLFCFLLSIARVVSVSQTENTFQITLVSPSDYLK